METSILVGASQGEKNVPGTARIYRVTASGLSLQSVLDTGPCGHAFGECATSDENRFVVGVACDRGQGIGTVNIYQVNNDSVWLEQQLITSDGSVYADSVAIDRDLIIIGSASADAGDFKGAGAAYVFRNNRVKWSEEVKLVPPETDIFNVFGWSVAASGNLVLVGDHSNEGGGNLSGAVFAFTFDNGSWTLAQILRAADARVGEQWFGWSVALDAAGDTAVIGAKEDMGQLGSAYVFEYINGAWVETQKLMAVPSFGSPTYFGYDVDISDDGNIIIVGAQSDSESGPGAGAAHLFQRAGNRWIETFKFIRPGSNCLGASVALHGDYALVGDPCENGFSGAVYYLGGILGIDCNGNGISDACDIAPGMGASFDSNANGVPDECEGLPDFDGDGDVGPADLADLLAGWGKCRPPKICAADLNMDGSVGPADLAQLLALWGQIIIPPPCPSSAEDCCAAHDSPGCGDSQCCDAVCEVDAFCCELSWDAICVNEAQVHCGCAGPKKCGESGAGDCCAFNGLDGPGCNDAQCCETICDYVDPFCCDVQWDASCAQWAIQFCQPCPPIQCSPDAGPCCEPTFAPGCNDTQCCSLICEEIDPFCCDAAWDGICAAEALMYCEICGGTPPGE